MIGAMPQLAESSSYGALGTSRQLGKQSNGTGSPRSRIADVARKKVGR
jgi:hypothetical protein